ncbi:MAG: hypothetical protein WDA25_06875 [Paracoccaceae bacterium]
MRRDHAPGFAPILVGFILWAVGFLALYAGHATGCELGWHMAPALGTNLLRLVLIGGAVGLLAALLATGWWMRRHPVQGFVIRLGYYALIAATLSAVVNFFAVFWLPLC